MTTDKSLLFSLEEWDLKKVFYCYLICTTLGAGFFPTQSYGQTRLDDSLSLVDMYLATDGPNWNVSWDLNQPMDSWFGVFIQNNRVSCLDLDGFANCSNDVGTGGSNNLSGNLVDLNMDSLVGLFLSDNQITGSVIDFSGLPVLENLYVQSNLLDGSVPDFSGLSSLKVLNLTGNLLSGGLQNFSNLQNLEFLYIGANQLGGLVPDFSNLPNLIELGLSNNQLSGYVPDFSNLQNLRTLYLSYNNLSGPVPDFSGLVSMETAYLNHNQLTGGVPDFSNLPSIRSLLLYNNQLSGIIPEFSNTPNLNSVNLRRNKLTFKELTGSHSYLDSMLFAYQYSQQDSIPLNRIGNQYFTNAGSAIQDNTYNWYKDGTLVVSIPANEFYTPTSSGIYYCEIVNSQLTGLTLYSKSTYLTSDSIVYPGDANANGIVEATDVLYIGNAYANTGSPRSNASSNWTPQIADNWQATVRGINGKHQDCNGDGSIGDLDLLAIQTNFDSITPAYLNQSSASLVNNYYFDIKPITDTTVVKGNQTYLQRRYNVCLRNMLGGPVSAKGISFSIDYAYSSPGLNMFTKTDNSALGNTTDLRKVERFNQDERRLDAGMFTVTPDVTINGPVTQIIIEELLSGVNLLEDSIDLQVADISVLMLDTLLPANGQSVYQLVGSDSTNFGNGISATVTANYPDCMNLGMANAYVTDPGLFFYEWSTGETTPTISGLAPGEYSVTVTSIVPTDIPAIIPFSIPAPVGCPNTASLSTKLYLEGALSESSFLMSDALRTKDLLPLYAPFPVKDSMLLPVLLTNGGPGIIDWVEIELRSGNDSTLVVNRCAALICSNGAIVSTDGFSPVELAAVGVDSVYVVFNHRNHLPIMVGPVSAVDPVDLDLTQANLTSNVNSMKEVIPGVWALFVGDASNDKTVDGFDKLLWNNLNGNFNRYLNVDFNFDGDISGADRIIWAKNNGRFSTVP